MSAPSQHPPAMHLARVIPLFASGGDAPAAKWRALRTMIELVAVHASEMRDAHPRDEMVKLVASSLESLARIARASAE